MIVLIDEIKGRGHIKYGFSVYSPHTIAPVWASLAPGTLGLDDRFTVCSNIMLSTKR